MFIAAVENSAEEVPVYTCSTLTCLPLSHSQIYLINWMDFQSHALWPSSTYKTSEWVSWTTSQQEQWMQSLQKQIQISCCKGLHDVADTISADTVSQAHCNIKIINPICFQSCAPVSSDLLCHLNQQVCCSFACICEYCNTWLHLHYLYSLPFCWRICLVIFSIFTLTIA